MIQWATLLGGSPRGICLPWTDVIIFITFAGSQRVPVEQTYEHTNILVITGFTDATAPCGWREIYYMTHQTKQSQKANLI